MFSAYYLEDAFILLSDQYDDLSVRAHLGAPGFKICNQVDDNLSDRTARQLNCLGGSVRGRYLYVYMESGYMELAEIEVFRDLGWYDIHPDG